MFWMNYFFGDNVEEDESIVEDDSTCTSYRTNKVGNIVVCNNEIEEPADEDQRNDCDNSTIRSSFTYSSIDNSTLPTTFTLAQSFNVPTGGVDYVSSTPLFELLERREWERVLRLLNTGILVEVDLQCQVTTASPAKQVRTWVCSENNEGKLLWRQLPIHAAITHDAPEAVVQKIVEMYPESLECTDLDGNLPMHLAFQHYSRNSVLAVLLRAFPDSINIINGRGLRPFECGKHRGEKRMKKDVFLKYQSIHKSIPKTSETRHPPNDGSRKIVDDAYETAKRLEKLKIEVLKAWERNREERRDRRMQKLRLIQKQEQILEEESYRDVNERERFTDVLLIENGEGEQGITVVAPRSSHSSNRSIYTV